MTGKKPHRPTTDNRHRTPRPRGESQPPGGTGEEGLPERPTAQQGPREPTELPKQSWWATLKRTVKEFQNDNLSDWAAALTYYGILSMFPGMLLLISALRLTGPHTTQAVINNLSAMAPGAVRQLIIKATTDLQRGQQGTAGVFAIVGLAGALWSASGYIGAFMRASNAIYDVPEGRPAWKKLPIRVGVTLLVVVLLFVIALSVVFTGGFAAQLGRLIGLGTGVVRVWDIVKWPVMVIMVSFVFALLYWASPNARPGGFRWVSPGGLLAVLVWLIASGGFAIYVANFASYNKIYGSLAGIIIFLVWLWISNIAILLGAEFDAELQRTRAIRAGHPPEKEPYVELRDTRKIKDQE
ncbi:YihY/virulence factor BrkB family protein [Planosporangium mesophilum]|nr:YihY/virulence factor BrkB family protein [Planosporangium mesophilum]NJC85025.1 YihY/virulence factor BrkB family protein [Planosporangium mesophilum]